MAGFQELLMTFHTLGGGYAHVGFTRIALYTSRVYTICVCQKCSIYKACPVGFSFSKLPFSVSITTLLDWEEL